MGYISEEEIQRLKEQDWRNLDDGNYNSKPNNHEICLVWEYKLDWQLGIYIAALDKFGGNFSGYNPRWWMRLTNPEEI